MRFRVPRITPARPQIPVLSDGVSPTAASDQLPAVSGWCTDCYEAGSYTLTDGQLCLFHGPGQAGRTTPAGSAGPLRVGRGPAATGPGLSPALARARALRRSTGMAYGRRRAAARVRAGRFQVHPGWRGRIPDTVEVILEQAAALERITALIEAELWCPRQRREWTAMLSAMVWAMDWRTGLITGVTREHLAATVGRSTRSVSRMWRWAHDTGLLTRVEEGASAQWLGTRHNRSATFVLTAPLGTEATRRTTRDRHASAQLTGPVDQNGNPPASCVEEDPLGRTDFSPITTSSRWLWWRIPETPSQRRAAASEVLRRTALDNPRVDVRRVHGLLLTWWDAGASPAGLLHMLDHHPDHPHQRRGPAFHGARDPLAVMGYRLAPWTGRISELPPHVQGRRGDYLTAQKARLTALLTPPTTELRTPTPTQARRRPHNPRRVRPQSHVLPRPTRTPNPNRIEPQPGASTYDLALARARNETRSAPERP